MKYVRTICTRTDKPFKSSKNSKKKWGRVVLSKIVELINSIFKTKEEEILLDDRFEFRLNKNEKILIKKYCDLQRISASEFFRKVAMKEIDNFIKAGR